MSADEKAPSLVDLRSSEAAHDGRYGGKAAGLARLASAEARVPAGFAVEASRLEPRSWPPALRDEFERRLSALLAHGPVAVRSSAAGEDGVERSFAGIFETVLGVGSLGDALEAAAHCIASGDTARLYAYAGPRDPVPVGLVVQQQVGARSAGVCFTRDPTGREDAVVIEAVSGLGQQLVAGQVEPECWRVGRGGRRGHQARREGNGPVVLDAAEAVEIAREARALAERLGGPLDLEWARDGQGRLWWLQARPVTAVAEAAHPPVERGAPLADDGPVSVWSNFNLGETMPEPLPPLVWSLWRDRLLATLLRAFVPASLPDPTREQLVCVDRVGGRVYWNLNGLLAIPVFGALMLRLAEPFDLRAAARVSLLRRAGVLTRRRVPGGWGFRLRAVWHQLRLVADSCWSPERALAELNGLSARVRRSARRPLVERTPNELLHEIRVLTDPDFLELHRYVGVALFSGLSLELGRWLFRRHPEAQRRLAVGLRGNPTTEMSLELDALLERARPLADSFTSEESWETLLARLEERDEGRNFVQAFDAFLARNGQRGPQEFDLSVPRWSERPAFLLELIRAGLREPSKEPLRQRFVRLAEERRGAIDAALAASPAWQRPLLRWVTRAIERSMPLREAPKHHGLVVFARVREILLELGERLCAEGVLPRRDDVFYLDWRELETWPDGESLAERVAERRAALERFAARPAPEFLRSDGVAVPDPLLPRVRAEPGVLRGAGLGTGCATGRVRVLHSPDPGALHPGEVLVVRHADPGWTPLFPRASALVMEVGGIMCHAAVVARELGIPAVFGARDATRLLGDGQLVTVDGVEGSVRPVAPPEPPAQPSSTSRATSSSR